MPRHAKIVGNIKLSETSQALKDKYSMLLLDVEPSVVRFTETGSRRVVATGWGVLVWWV